MFKDLRLKYYITQLIGIGILLCLNYFIYEKTNNKALYSVFVFMTLIYATAIGIIFIKKAIKRISDLSIKANKNENIQEVITTYEELLTRTKNIKMKTQIIINITGLYIKIGQTKKALTLYKDFKPKFDKSIIGKLNQILYLNNICQICIREELYSLAEENLKLIKKLSEIENYNKETKDKINKIHNDLVIELIFKKNEKKDYKSIEKYYLKRFEEETNNSNKIFFAYQLIKVYKKLKNKTKEKKYKDYYENNRKEQNYN